MTGRYSQSNAALCAEILACRRWGKYDATPLVDYVRWKMDCKTDLEMCQLLEIHPGTISAIRSGQRVGAALMIRFHKGTGHPVRLLEQMINGDERQIQT